MANDDTSRHLVVLSEFELPFLNGMQRSVNRKVQGSNPWSGANSRVRLTVFTYTEGLVNCRRRS